MVDQALPTSSPITGKLSTHPATAKEQATPAAKSSAGASDGKASRQQKLKSHLLIGFLMVFFAIAGYALFGPHSHVNAAGSAGNHIINISSPPLNSTSALSAGYANQTANELAMLQAEMDEINRQINAVKFSNGLAGNVSNSGSALNTSSTTDPVQSQMNLVNKMNAQTNGGNSAAANGGHGHH
jgi:hypothetical protein